MSPERFVSQLMSLQFRNAFNPYRDRCPTYDLENASCSRAEMLKRILSSAMTSGVDSIWVGRDLGYRGGRRTGLALTDDINFHAHLARWQIDMDRPTFGQPVPERTASVIWRMLHQINCPVFLWNVFPLHPHAPGLPFSNRNHNRLERKAGMEVLSQLISLLKPRRVVAIGNDADDALKKIIEHHRIVKVRHPSYGGQTDFVQLISETYDLRDGPLL